LQKQRFRVDAWAIGVIALAAALRLAHLAEIPTCLEYDEAANVILAGEIARGQSFPVFIRPYTGKEVLYFYLAAGTMKLAGITPFAIRLTSAFLGVLGVALTYWFVRELFALTPVDDRTRRWLALVSAGLVATSYWQVNLSRFGYRAIALPPLLALTFGLLLRGLRLAHAPAPQARQERTEPPRFPPQLSTLTFQLSTCNLQLSTLNFQPSTWLLALAGISTGLSAYTYSSVRVLPILLLLSWIWVFAADHRQWRRHLRHLSLLGLAAAVVFAPLGLFFLRNPETFSVRLEQVSVFSPAVNQGDLWGTLWRTVRMAYGMFTISGDMNPLYNYPGKPIFDRLLGPFFYIGLLICAWRLLQTPGSHEKPGSCARLPYFVLLTWIPVMMIPNILSARGVPHNLRAMALVPAVYIVTALGLVTVAGWIGHLLTTGSHSPLVRRRFNLLLPVSLALILGYEGARTYYDYVHVWAGSAGPYYKGNTALIQAADLLNERGEADPYVATYFQQHATLAVHARDYLGIRWMSGGTLVLPPPDARPTILVYDHTNPVDPVLRQRFLPPETLLHRQLGPDGEVGFEAFLLDTKTRAPARSAGEPGFYADTPMNVNLGNTLTFLGYDLNAPVASGDVLDVTLYYHVLRAVERNDFTFFAHMVDDLGFRWGGQTFFYYPSAQWRQGEVLIYRLQLPIAPGAPPGAYALNVGVHSPSLDARLPVLNEAGQMAGTAVSVGPIQVARAAAPTETWPTIQAPLEAVFGEELAFLGSDRDRSDLLPGQTLALTLYWQAQQAPAQDYQVEARLVGAGGEVLLWRGHPVHGLYPFASWQAGEFVRDRYALRLPIDAPAGDYDLRLALLDEGGNPVLTADDSTALSLGTIHVHASDRLWEVPPFEHPVGARLGEAFELLGYDLDRDRVQPGETVHLTLIWRCRETTDTAYTVFTHLLDAGEQIRGQKDNPPVNGAYPTTLWVRDEIVVDRYPIPVDADAAPGRHVIEVGMYDPVTIQRLPVLDPSGTVGDRVLLADIQVLQQ
jgi:4-amino-4-deoxy-L-arabinose transferase-like glycosyltransferase